MSSAVYESSRQSYDVYDDDCLYDSGTDYYYEPLENYPSEREQIEACADTFIVNGRTYIPKRCYRNGQVGRAYHNEIPQDERYPLSQKLRQLFAATNGDLQRLALYKLLQQVERHADLLGLKTGFHNWPRDEGNNYEDAHSTPGY